MIGGLSRVHVRQVCDALKLEDLNTIATGFTSYEV